MVVVVVVGREWGETYCSSSEGRDLREEEEEGKKKKRRKEEEGKGKKEEEDNEMDC